MIRPQVSQVLLIGTVASTSQRGGRAEGGGQSEVTNEEVGEGSARRRGAARSTALCFKPSGGAGGAEERLCWQSKT